MPILRRTDSTRNTNAVDVSPTAGCIPKNCSSIWSRDRPNYSSTSLTNACQEGNGPLTCCHPRPPRIYGPNLSKCSSLNYHSKEAKEGSRERSARATELQKDVRSWGSGSVVSAKGTSCVLSSFMIWAGTWVAAVCKLNGAFAGGGGGAGGSGRAAGATYG
jgi:hypothetical protein